MGICFTRGVNRGMQIRRSAKINVRIRRSAQKINLIRVRYHGPVMRKCVYYF